MSEFHVKVVRVGAVEKHPNADTLSISKVMGEYPVIFRTGEFKEGDLAVYVPVDAMVPANDPKFAHLGDHLRVRARRLRGVFSMGLLVAPEPGWSEGQAVAELMHIKKHVPPWERDVHGSNESDPGTMPVYDLEGLLRWSSKLTPGERVMLVEKIEGENGRFLFHEGRLWVGSRTRVKKNTPDSQWWKAARGYNLEESLARHPGVVVYGETHGYVSGFPYKQEPGSVGLRLFDAWMVAEQRWLQPDEFDALLADIDVPRAPVLYDGPWDPSPEFRDRFANGKSTLDDSHIREGFVVRAVPHRMDEECGRVVFKYKGSDYLLRKGG